MDRVRVGGILADDLRVIKLVDDVLGVLNEVLSLVREGDALVSARDEETPQFIFQIADRLGEILCKEIGCKIAAEFRTFGKGHQNSRFLSVSLENTWATFPLKEKRTVSPIS